MSYIEPGILVALFLACLGMIPGVKRRGGGILTLIALLGLFCWSFPPLATFHASLLESPYSVDDPSTSDARAIVVLSGGLEVMPVLSRTFAGTSTFRRAIQAAWLNRNWRALPVLASGGHIGGADSEESAGEIMKGILLSRGVPADQIWVEGDSNSTYENAEFSAEILRKRGISSIVLVTDGVHLLRSVLCFRKQGLDVTPVSAWNVADGDFEHWYQFLPNRGAIEINESCLHEWLGLVYYRIKGYI